MYLLTLIAAMSLTDGPDLGLPPVTPCLADVPKHGAPPDAHATWTKASIDQRDVWAVKRCDDLQPAATCSWEVIDPKTCRRVRLASGDARGHPADSLHCFHTGKAWTAGEYRFLLSFSQLTIASPAEPGDVIGVLWQFFPRTIAVELRGHPLQVVARAARWKAKTSLRDSWVPRFTPGGSSLDLPPGWHDEGPSTLIRFTAADYADSTRDGFRWFTNGYSTHALLVRGDEQAIVVGFLPRKIPDLKFHDDDIAVLVGQRLPFGGLMAAVVDLKTGDSWEVTVTAASAEGFQFTKEKTDTFQASWTELAAALRAAH